MERRAGNMELEQRVDENNRLLREHITRTDERFDNLTDIVTRVAHATEDTKIELSSHKTWEEGYHAEEKRKDAERDEKFDKLVDDLSLYFKTKSTSKNAAEFAAWLAKLGIFGIVLLWLWNNAVTPMLKKFGVF